MLDDVTIDAHTCSCNPQQPNRAMCFTHPTWFFFLK
jgi:hypothetical protein